MTARSYRRKPSQAEPVAHERDELEARYGHVWDTRQLARVFILLGIQPARLFVRRKNDGMMGWLAYQNAPRFWLKWRAILLPVPKEPCRSGITGRQESA